MQNKAVILTPNRNLANYLQNQFYLSAIQKNITTWRCEKILPLTAWLAECWQECEDPRVLLNSHQERLLWQQVIGKDYSGIVDAVIKAHELVINWQLNDADWSDHKAEDIVTFSRLKKEFTEYCKRKNFVVACQLPLLLLPHLQTHDLKITFAGFDEYSPQLQAFVEGLQKGGCEVAYYSSNKHENSVHKKLSFTQQEEEIATIARWAKQIILHNPKTSIGVVATSLTDLRPKIVRVFNEVLGSPEKSDAVEFSVSSGIVFSSLPIINCALELLTLHEPYNLKILNNVLLVPYIGGAETEKSNRAVFDFQLRQLNQEQFCLTDIELLAKKHSKNISILINALQRAQDLFAHIENKKLNNSEWVKIFAQLLQILGWPGETNLTEVESIAVKRFTALLHEFATTNIITGQTSYKQALQSLHDMAEHNLFQTEHETDVPINVLGIHEAAGINFDYLWVMGLDQESWPNKPSSNPFIPIKIQKEFGLPHSSAEYELYFCETLIKGFKRSAKKVIFSYARQIEDRVIKPSSLIADISEISVDDLDLAEFTSRAKESYYSRKIEPLIDTTSLALMPNEVIHGGSRLIESQSLCPFRAFAEFRLAAKELKQFEPGITKLKRGTLIHATLESFWQEVKTHQNLCELDQASLQDLIKECVESALDKEALSQQVYSLEQKCLIRLLNRWLEVEKNRPSFEVIATEKTIKTTLGSLQVKLRIDRIDRLTNGSLLLIDYKTGKKLPAIFDWFGKRPKNPQLPLYCVAVDEAQGFAFAQVNVESIKFKDISLDELAFGLQKMDENNFKNNINWHELIVYWQGVLIDLAKEFIAGYSQPEPLSPQVCKQCEFGIICRYVHNKAG
jgi:ATP-dependent helicase/nuclease subunit B